MIRDWISFIYSRSFWDEYKSVFRRKVAEAEAHRRKIASADKIRQRWSMYVRSKGLHDHRLSVVNLRPVNSFIGFMYLEPKIQRAYKVVSSFLKDTAARERLFSCFLQYPKRGN